MKLVFANASELVHIWTNQAQNEGRSRNMSFSTRHIYSYSMMIASFSGDGIVFLNNISSATSAVRSAASTSLTIFEYNSIPNWCKGKVARLHVNPCDVTPSEIWHQYRDIWCSLIVSARHRSFKRTASQRLALASIYAEKANSIAMRFYLDFCTLSMDIDSAISQFIEAENARKERKRIADLEQCIQERADWIEGKGRFYPDWYEDDIVLRVYPTDVAVIETSSGAFVPLRVCERLYRAFKTATMPDDREVGRYQLDKVLGEGLTIGCSFIKAEELERFAKVLGIAA